MSIFQAFKFKKKDTVIHRLDPRTKLYTAIMLFVLSFIFGEVVLLSLILLFSMLLLATARSLGQWFKTLRGLSFLLIFIVVVNTLLVNTPFALGNAMTMVIRLLDIMASFSIFFLTVHPDDLAQALIQLHVPFDFAFTLSMATRYVPTLAQETQTIMDAQMSRGLELQKGNVIRRIRNYIPILIPLIVSSIRRAMSIAESLESRAFGSTKNRTYLYRLRMAKKDYFVVLMMTLAIALSIYLKFFGGLPLWTRWQIPL
ncbi:MAG: energy-coupling factor transporter transmembrane component T [Candidatus Atabeyarchaeum deiterrae]